MDNITYIHRLDGNYLGFIADGALYSRDGINLGFVENRLVWDVTGNFRGVLVTLPNGNFILRNILSIPALSRAPRPLPTLPQQPAPAANLAPATPPTGYVDAF